MNKLFKKFGTYKAFVKCPNCNYGSEVKIPKGISVAEFVKGGECKCDNCQVVFFPNEYTTGFFEKEKRKGMDINLKKTKKTPKEIKW